MGNVDTEYTKEWLLSVGFEEDPDRSPGDMYVRMRVCDRTFLMLLENSDPISSAFFCKYDTVEDEETGDHSSFIVASRRGSIRTRGDVRALCAALKVPLEEDPTSTVDCETMSMLEDLKKRVEKLESQRLNDCRDPFDAQALADHLIDIRYINNDVVDSVELEKEIRSWLDYHRSNR